MRQSVDRRIRVFVHLAHGFGAQTWYTRWCRGEIIGLNERLPYGYFRAEQDGCDIEYSEDKEERLFGKAVTLLHGSAGWRRELGGVGRRPLP